MKTNSSKALVGAALAFASCAAFAQPAITASGTTLTFPSTPVFVTSTTPSPATITLTNTGTEALTITGISKSGANSTEFTPTGTCVGDSVKVEKGATCTISATFVSLVAGSRSATFTLQSNAATNPSITLAGTAQIVATPSIVLSEAPSFYVQTNLPIVFNTQTVGEASAARQITVTNNSTAQVSVMTVTSTPDPAEFASTTDCVGNLAAGDLCTISVTFTPVMAAAARTGTITITSNVSGAPRTVALSGPGVTAPIGAGTLSANTLGFPETPSGVTATVMRSTLKNTGNKELALTAVAINGTNAAEFASSAGTTCAAGMLAVDQSCVLEVSFKPESTGGKSASLVVTHDAGTSTVALSGTGTAPLAPPPSATPPPTTPTPAPTTPSGQSDEGGGGALGGLGLLLLIPPLVLRARRLSLAR